MRYWRIARRILVHELVYSIAPHIIPPMLSAVGRNGKEDFILMTFKMDHVSNALRLPACGK